MKHFKTLLLLFFVALFSCENPVDPPNPPETFTVTYFSSGHESGAIPVDSIAYENGMTVSVKGNSGTLIRTGYTFNGWNTEPGFNGVSRTPGSTFTMGSSDVSLYAEWTANSYTVTFDYQDGVSETTTATVEYDSAYGALPGPSRVGYTLMGWYTDTSFITEVTASTILSTASDHTLYAKWSTQVISVSFDAQSGSFTNSQAKTKNVEFDAAYGSLPEVTRTGYTFLGWFTQPDGLGGQVTSSTIVSNPTGHSLFAAWTANTYTLTFIAESGQPAFSIQSIVFDTTYENLLEPTLAGYTFEGWYLSQDYSGNAITTSTVFSTASDTTVYAKWNEIPTYSVIYHKNGADFGDIPVDNKRYEEGSTVTVRWVSFLSRSGYTFLGWNTDPLGGGTFYDYADSFKMPGKNVDLYAAWSKNPTYTVTYETTDSESGAAPVDPNRYEKKSEVTVLGGDDLIRDGYYVSSWNSNALGTGKTYSIGDTFLMPAENVILYPQWSVIPTYSVKYISAFAESGTAPVDNTAYRAGATVTVLGQNDMYRYGYTFEGWITGYDGSGIVYAEGDTFTMPSEEFVLVPNWVIIPTYRVYYYGNGQDSGDPPVNTYKYREGNWATISEPGTLKKAGFAFVKWTDNPEGTGFGYYPGNGYQIGTSDLHLYAYWSTPEIAVESQGTPLVHSSGTVNLGRVLVDGAGASTAGEISIKIKNVGEAALNISDISITSGDTSDFNITQTISSSISAGSSAIFKIDFDPLSAGNKSAVITIASDDPNLGAYTFAVEGRAEASPAVVSITPSGTENALNATISIQFSKPVNTVTAENSISISPAVNGSFSWNADSSIVTFTPSTDLAEAGIYNVEVASNVYDTFGYKMTTIASESFKTIYNTFSDVVNYTNGHSTWSQDATIASGNGFTGVVWCDTVDTQSDPDNSGGELYYTKLDSNGVELISPVRLTNKTGSCYDPEMVWTGQYFGIVWKDDRTIYFMMIDENGTIITPTARVGSPHNYGSVEPAIVWNGTRFGVSWGGSQTGNPRAAFVQVNTDGSLYGDILYMSNQAGYNTSITWNAKRNLYRMFFTAFGNLNYADIESTGVLDRSGGIVSYDGSGCDYVNIQWVDDGSYYGMYVYSWSEKTTLSDEGYVCLMFSADSSIITMRPGLSKTMGKSDIVVNGDEVGIIWIDDFVANQSDVFFARYDFSGNMLGSIEQLSNTAVVEEDPHASYNQNKYISVWDASQDDIFIAD